MRKVIIWGAGADYEGILNQIKFEICKGNILVKALISKQKDIVSDYLDGFKVISLEELPDYEYDYIIISSRKYYGDILKEAKLLGIKRSKIIDGSILNMPNFDFKRYAQLIENPVTILSDDCWGGIIYHKLGLRFTSPFINILVQEESYAKFIQDPVYYFSQPLVMEREGDVRRNLCPLGSIGKGEKKVQLDFLHVLSFREAEALWNERKKRVNYDNIFVKMGFNVNEKSEKFLEVFDKVLYNKVCFFSGETDVKSVLYLKRFEWYMGLHLRGDTIHFGYNDYCRIIHYFCKSVDLLKLLNGEPDFVREW